VICPAFVLELTKPKIGTWSGGGRFFAVDLLDIMIMPALSFCLSVQQTLLSLWRRLLFCQMVRCLQHQLFGKLYFLPFFMNLESKGREQKCRL
jgi:hypothetical protein